MMKYKPSEAYYKEFTTSRFSTGAAYDATGTPTATANKNGTDDGTFSLTVTNIDTGRFKVTGTVPAGYADGDIVNITVAATVDGVAAKGVIDTFLVVSSREADIKADTAAILLDTGTDGVVVAAGSKTGYSISGVKTTLDALNDITAAAVWAATTRTLTAGTNIALAKGTGVTGFNDIAAADVWSVATRALTDKAGFSLAADQSAVTVGTVNSVADKTGYALSTAGVDAILDDVVEGTYTMRQLVRLFASTLFAKSAGGGTATLTARDLGDTKNRITLTVDANGNRTAVTLDGA